MLGVFNPFTGVNSGILCVANKIVNVQNSGIETLVSERYRHRQQLPVMCSYIKRIREQKKALYNYFGVKFS